MTKIEKKALFKAIICLLKTSLMDTVDKPSKELKKAKKNYVESTIKLLEELLWQRH